MENGCTIAFGILIFLTRVFLSFARGVCGEHSGSTCAHRKSRFYFWLKKFSKSHHFHINTLQWKSLYSAWSCVWFFTFLQHCIEFIYAFEFCIWKIVRTITQRTGNFTACEFRKIWSFSAQNFRPREMTPKRQISSLKAQIEKIENWLVARQIRWFLVFWCLKII